LFIWSGFGERTCVSCVDRLFGERTSRYFAKIHTGWQKSTETDLYFEFFGPTGAESPCKPEKWASLPEFQVSHHSKEERAGSKWLDEKRKMGTIT
jgi:hypothetical protein